MNIQREDLIQHLEEFRRRLIYTVAVFLFFIVVSFFYVDKIFALLRRASGHDMKLIALGPGDVLHVYFLVASVSALIPTLPFALWQVWRFVAPALGEAERTVVIRYIPGVIGMFLLGIAFGWFVIFPMVFTFLYNLGSQEFSMMISASNYFGFMLNIVLPLGLLFEMPVVVMFLTRLGVLTPAKLIQVRKYAYFVLVIIASMISPPEFVSHISVAIPLILLYEVSILTSKWTWRKRPVSDRAEERSSVRTD